MEKMFYGKKKKRIFFISFTNKRNKILGDLERG